MASWLDRAKENNGGRYSETHVENVKVLAKLFPLYGLQLLYRACITQVGHSLHGDTLVRFISLYVNVKECISLRFPQATTSRQ